jgi:hypothetical protein
MPYDALVALGVGLLQNGQADDGLAAIESAFVLRPGHPFAACARALALAAVGRPHEALVTADEVLAATGATYLDRVIAGVAAGLAAARLHERDEAMQRLDAAGLVAGASDDVVARAMVSLARFEAGLCEGEATPDVADDVGGWAVALRAAATGNGAEPLLAR